MKLRPVALVVALEEELAPLAARLPGFHPLKDPGPWDVYGSTQGPRPVVAILSDCGPANAAAACERLITRYAPVAVLTCGSAGAHDPDLLPGDVVIGSGYRVLVPVAVQEARARAGLHEKGIRFRRDGRRVHLSRCATDVDLLEKAVRASQEVVPSFAPWSGPGWPPGVPAREPLAVTGLVGSADGWNRDPDAIRSLRELYGTSCEDMESASLAQLCALHGLPFISIRVVSNNETRCPLSPAEIPAAIAAAGERAAALLARVVAAF